MGKKDKSSKKELREDGEAPAAAAQDAPPSKESKKDKKRKAKEEEAAAAEPQAEEPAPSKKKSKQQPEPEAEPEPAGDAEMEAEEPAAPLDPKAARAAEKALRDAAKEAKRQAKAAKKADPERQAARKLKKEEGKKAKAAALGVPYVAGVKREVPGAAVAAEAAAAAGKEGGNLEEALHLRKFVQEGAFTFGFPKAEGAAAEATEAAEEGSEGEGRNGKAPETAAAAPAPAAAEEEAFKPRNARERAAFEAAQRETEEKIRRLTEVDAQGNDPRRVYIGGMSFRYSEEDIRGVWAECGEIEEVDMMTFPDTGRFKGIAFLTYKTAQGAKEALKFDGEELDGQTLAVRPARAKPKHLENRRKSDVAGADGENGARAASGADTGTAGGAHLAKKVPGYNVAYVGNIAFEATEEDLKEIFSDCNVKFIRIHTDKDTGKPKGFAHVHFSDEDGLAKAIGLHGAQLHGRKVSVGYAQPKKVQK